MCKCKVNDHYEGVRVEDIPELASNLKELKTDFKKWETIYICTVCGQKWLEKYVQKGHGEIPEIRKID